MARIDAGMCERLITAATSHCSVAAVPALTPIVRTVREPNWEGVTTGLTALSTAFLLVSLGIGLLALIAGFAWAYVVRVQAVKEASQAAEVEAKKIAEEFTKRWLEEKAPAVVRGHVEMLAAVQLGPKEDGNGAGQEPNAADEIGNAAGP